DPNAEDAVDSIAVQADGKILVGDSFTSIGGQTRNYIARLNEDGTPDADFNPNANGSVDSIAVQADGKILVGGWFTNIGGVTRNYIARLNEDGTPDDFNPNANFYVESIAVQADGKILVGGYFTSIGGQTRNKIARLKADGTPDADFNPNASDAVYSIAVQADGKILVGGAFTTIGGQARNRIARLNSDTEAVQELTVSEDGKTITWMRGGSSPEVYDVTFEYSEDKNDWSAAIYLGAGTRITGGWQLQGQSLPLTGYVRARGKAYGGYQNGSTSLMETVKLYNNQPGTHILTVTKDGTGTGTVTAGVNCTLTWIGDTGTCTVDDGKEITLSGSAAAGSYFEGWSNGTGSAAGCTGTGDCKFNITADSGVTATFRKNQPNQYTVTASPGVNGSLDPSTPSPQTVNYGSTTSFKFNANGGYHVASVSGCWGNPYNNSADSVPSYTYTTGAITGNCTVTATFAANQQPDDLVCTDGGLPCLERTDGGSDGDNLEDGKPKVGLEYRFTVWALDQGGKPQYVRLYLAQRSNPDEADFYPYDLACAGDYATGADCTYTTKLGPAHIHKYCFEMKTAGGAVVTYPEKGCMTGPVIEMMNGDNILGIPRDVSSPVLDGATAFGSEEIYGWLSTGLTTDKNYGSYERVDSAPVEAGEGYYVERGAASAIPDLDAYADIAASTYAAALSPGWNIISNPYGGNVKLSSVQVQKGSESPIAWSSAVNSGWLVNAIYYFNGSDWGSTYSFESAGGAPDATLAPWLGYWVYLDKDDDTYTLIITKP
ncbi:MAG: hypothetical protein M1497_01930, partial [Nitrospirae bacterium]|nr:hypothetical protein [Nitrospirota bacterium]